MTSTATAARGGRRVLVILTAYLALAMTFVTGRSLPAMVIPIRDEFALSVDSLSTLQSAPELAGLLVVFAAGAMAVRLGRRAVLALASAGVALGALLVSIAPSGVAVVGAWSVVGLGTVALTVAGLSTVNAAFDDPRSRGRAFAGIAAVGPIVSLTVPNVCAAIASSLGWRWIPLIWLGLAAVLMVLALACAPRRVAADGPHEFATPLLAGIALSSLCLCFSTVGSPGMLTAVSAAVAVLAGAGTAVLLRRLDRPGLDLRALRDRRGLLAGIAIVLVWGIDLLFFINLYLQFRHDLGVGATIGLLTLCEAAGLAGTVLFGFLSGRMGPQRTAFIAMAVTAVTSLLLLAVTDATPAWVLVAVTAAIMVTNFGAIGPVTAHFLDGAPSDGSDGASAAADALSNVGFAAGAAVFSLVIFGAFSTSLEAGLRAHGYPPSQAQSIAAEIRGGTESRALVARDADRDPLLKAALVDDPSTIADAQVSALHALGLAFAGTFGAGALVLIPGLRRRPGRFE